VFEVPLGRVREPTELPGRTIALVAGSGDPLDLMPAAGDVTIVVGAEREGLPGEIVAACDETATIPQRRGDSLNAAMAATIALYECSRRMARP
jgi:TrmH family RNA methyltransferase